MANVEADSGTATSGYYDVFLSFRGPDTRNGFADCLYEFLSERGLCIFRDEEELHHGKKISEILRAVKSSQIYIPIFSKDYASSKWCLRELTYMVQCTCQSTGKEILPIFYDVDPSDVKLQTELYRSALKKHEEKLGCTEVKPWKEALTTVARIKGWCLKGQREGKVIKDIVQKVLQKIPIRNRYLPPQLVGIDDVVRAMIRILDCRFSEVRYLIIHGRSGVGKTTLAKAVFNQLYPLFECRCFLADIRESSQCGGIAKIQRKIVADLLNSSLPEAFDFEEGNNVIRNRLPHKRVLLVFDDFSDDDQFLQLVGNSYKCGSGSRIIITASDKSVFYMPLVELWEKRTTLYANFHFYKMSPMGPSHALQLFNKIAFNTDSVPPDLYDLSKEIVELTGGVPSVLKVLGSHLHGQSKAKWISTREKLKEVPDIIHYDASFFVNKKKTSAMYTWEACDFFPEVEIDVLHDRLRDRGRQIVRRENNGKLGDRSRLWFPEMALDMVRAKQVDNCGSSKWIDLKPSLHDREVICGLINEKKALENNIEGIESQLTVSQEKVHVLQMQLERSKRKNNKIQVEVSQLEAKEKIYLRGIVALIGLVCAMLLLKLDKKTQLSLP